MIRLVPENKQTVSVGDSNGTFTVTGCPFYISSRAYCVVQCDCGLTAVWQASHVHGKRPACKCSRTRKRRSDYKQRPEQPIISELPMRDGVEFRKVENFDDYAIGSDGSLWTKRKPSRHIYNRHWREMRPSPNHWGYLITVICNESGKKNVAVHKLVAHAFHGPCPKGLETRHLDGNCRNNAASNLKYGTKSENAQDAILAGTHPCLRMKNSPALSPTAKLNAEMASQIRAMAASGMNSIQIAATGVFPVSASSIQRVVSGATWSQPQDACKVAVQMRKCK